MKVTMRKSPRTLFAILLVVLVVLLTGCESEVGPATVPPAKMGTPVRLVFTAEPSEATAGLPFDPQPVVAAVDERGNIATSYRGRVVLTITAGTGASGAHLYGGINVPLVNGVVEFRDLFIDKAGAGYTLTATWLNLEPATSKPFDISPGAPDKLAFTTQPSDGVAGSPLAVQPAVTVQDRYGNAVTGYEGSVTLSGILEFRSRTRYGNYKAEIAPVAISGTTTVPVVNDVAQFKDISATKAIPGYRLIATSDSLQSATSSSFDISAGDPVKLEFTVQPGGAVAGTPFETQPKVAIMDTYGNVVISSRSSITMAITQGSGTASAVLSGTTTLVAKDAMGGLAEYTDLSIDLPGTGYTLTATSSGLKSATSQIFDVVAP